MSTETERKNLISSIRSLRTMERLQCSPEACSATAKLVEANIDALIEVARREAAENENERLRKLGDRVLAAHKAATSDPKLGGEA